jgi:hypothetical protein
VRDTNLWQKAAATTTVDALDPPTDMDISGTLIYCPPVSSQTSTVTINSVTAGVGPLPIKCYRRSLTMVLQIVLQD